MGLRAARRVHRLVVLPDYQGLGVGQAMLHAVAAHETGSPRTPEENPQRKKYPQISQIMNEQGIGMSASAKSAQSADKLRSEVSFSFADACSSADCSPSADVTRFSITTGHPGLIRTLCRDRRWRVSNVSKLGQPQREMSRRLHRAVWGSHNRSTVSFVYRGASADAARPFADPERKSADCADYADSAETQIESKERKSRERCLPSLSPPAQSSFLICATCGYFFLHGLSSSFCG
jgi:hypothetical protein